MATMWPKRVPSHIRNHPLRRAEVLTYDKLANVLDDNFHVFYSSPWLGMDRYGNERDGECDFLIAHPKLGILAIEVKGGEISFDPKARQWRSKSAQKITFDIKDPVEQARSAKHELLDKLKKSKKWKPRRIHTSHGIIFPDAVLKAKDLGADRPAKIFCASRRFRKDLEQWIKERMSFNNLPEGCHPLGTDGIRALEHLLALPFCLNHSIAVTIDGIEEEISTLEQSQYFILDYISGIPRALIRGGAGTGKTVLAMEAAVRSARGGKRTLLTCYNRPLANSMAHQLGEEVNLKVAGFHSLCGAMATESGTPKPEGGGRDFYDTVLPDILDKSMQARPDLKWDTVIVDEGQDFQQNWWVAIDSCLKAKGELRIFLDSNQRLYNRDSILPGELDTVPVPLTRNLRNTVQIHKAASVHYIGDDFQSGGPEGVAINWIEENNHEARLKCTISTLTGLLHEQDLDVGDIAVLVNAQDDKNAIREKCGKLAMPVAEAKELEPEKVVVDTVRSFKGLERPVIILLSGDAEVARKELAYVAFSRARAHLYVIASSEEMHFLRHGKDLPPAL